MTAPAPDSALLTTTALATHVLLECWGLDHAVLDDAAGLEETLLAAARAARCEVLGAVKHHFHPQGASVVVLVAESHLSVHTWPEHGYAAFDILTCGNALPEHGVAALLERLKPPHHSVQRIARGLQPGPFRQIP
ncbi:MAG: adenosylmethionine decarboxylase [Myxococcaceae bacterium]|nr:adenosylmethionine decarboxylase [Myxococcaceae bacterium]